MLKRLAFENFIHFEKKQTLKFIEPGSYYIVGENASGKSSIFELIRRCFSSTINKSVSSLVDPSKPAYVASHYVTSSELAKNIGNIVTKRLQLEGTFKAHNVYSYMQVKCHDDGKRIQRLVALVENSESDAMLLFDDNVYSLEKNQFKLGSLDKQHSYHSHKNLSQDTAILRLIENIFEKDEDMNFQTELEHTVKSMKVLPKVDSKDNTLCETVLKCIEDKFVSTFPMRSLGSLQWSKSEHATMEKRDENFEMPSEKAEILKDMLGLHFDKEEERKEAFIFNGLTYPLTFTVSAEKESGKTFIKITNENSNIQSELLKDTEGIIEAKQISLILSCKSFETICLEEVERGMGPLMIERLRDLMMECVKNKTVVITSHHPYFLSQWTIHRTFVCKKYLSEHKHMRHRVMRVNLPFATKLSNDEMKAIIFSSKVLFVKDSADKIIITAIFNHILDSHPKCVSYFKEDLSTVQKFVANILIVCMNGCVTHQHTQDIQENLDILKMHAYSRNTFYKQKNSKMLYIENEWPNSNDKKSFQASLKATHCRVWEIVHFFLQTANHSDEQVTLSDYEEQITNQKALLQKLNESGAVPGKLKKIVLDSIDDITILLETKNSIYERLRKVFLLYILPFGCELNSKSFLKKNFDIEENESNGSDNDLEPILLKRNIFVWKSGSLVDVICYFLLQSERKSEENTQLLKRVFPEPNENRKNPIRRCVSLLNHHMASTLASHILESDDMILFLNFIKEMNKCNKGTCEF